MNTTSLSTPISAARIAKACKASAPVDTYADCDRAFEIVRGQEVEKKMGVVQNLIASFLGMQIAHFCNEKRLGRLVVESPFAIPGSGNVRIPDVAFVSFQTWPVDRPIPIANAWAIVPDLAVEVISPSDKAFDVLEKVQEYFAGGVRQVWQVYSSIGQVWIFDSPKSIRILSRNDELTGDPLLPGFRVVLADLFPITESVA